MTHRESEDDRSSTGKGAHRLRAGLAVACILVYLAGMLVLISLAAESPLTPLIKVGHAAAAYCAIVAACIVAMVIFVRRIPVATPDEEGGTR